MNKLYIAHKQIQRGDDFQDWIDRESIAASFNLDVIKGIVNTGNSLETPPGFKWTYYWTEIPYINAAPTEENKHGNV